MDMEPTQENEVTKQQLREFTVVYWSGRTADGLFGPGEYIVKDMMDRATYNKPDRVGIGPRDRGVAFGANLRDLTIVR